MLNFLNNVTSLLGSYVSSDLWFIYLIPFLCIGIIIITVKVVFLCLHIYST